MKSSRLFLKSQARILSMTLRRTRLCNGQPNSFTEEMQLSSSMMTIEILIKRLKYAKRTSLFFKTNLQSLHSTGRSFRDFCSLSEKFRFIYLVQKKWTSSWLWQAQKEQISCSVDVREPSTSTNGIESIQSLESRRVNQNNAVETKFPHWIRLRRSAWRMCW